MTIELARTQALPKPWGVVDLRPWNRTSNAGVAIGEIWYDRPGQPSLRPSLLLKLLFTSEPLSIQVHPNDAFAQSIGLPNGKTEAWMVEGGAPSVLFRRGFSKTSLQAGTQIVVDGYRAKDGTNKMNAREITLADGRKLFAGSDGTGAPR